MDELIDKLVKELFTNGTGKQAERLVLEMKDGHDGGGWSRIAMKSFIKDFLHDEQAAHATHAALKAAARELVNAARIVANAAWNNPDENSLAKLDVAIIHTAVLLETETDVTNA